jgi:hypothetical protein
MFMYDPNLSEEDQKKLSSVIADDLAQMVGNQPPVLDYKEIMPIKLLGSALTVAVLCHFVLSLSWGGIIFSFLLLAVPFFIFCLFKARQANNKAFMESFSPPTKESYTYKTISESYALAYRFWMKLVFFCIWGIVLSLTSTYFI